MNPSLSSDETPGPRLAVAGVGHAGLRVLERLLTVPMPGASLIAVDADQADLLASGAHARVLLGRKRTRGLGTGADPVLGMALAEEAAPQIREALDQPDILVVVAGLGGGAGTGAAPVVSRLGRESGALVIGVVVTPFEFEGTRRHELATAGLRELKAQCDTVLVLANHRLSRLIDDHLGVPEVLGVCDDHAAQGVRGLWRLVVRRGHFALGLPELCQVTRGRHAESAFAHVEAAGEGRVQAVLDKLLRHPLLDDGALLGEADEVIVSIQAGPELSKSEILKISEQVRRAADKANLTFGAACAPEHAGRLAVTLIVSRRENAPADIIPAPESEPVPAELLGADDGAPEETRTPSRYLAPPPELLPEEKRREFAKLPSSTKRKARKFHSEQPELALQTISKGRFDNAEPTRANGEDLDIPTYVRRHISLVDLPSLS